MLEKMGAVVIDADSVAHEVYEPGTEGFDLLVERFGGGIVSDEGAIDRRLLGGIVFGDTEALADLNAIIHPLVRKEIARRMLEITRTRADTPVVIEAALMTETGWTGGQGTVWAVIASPEVVADRLVDQRGMEPEDVRLRLAAQATNEQRRQFATRVIENDGSLERLEAEVERAWAEQLASIPS